MLKSATNCDTEDQRNVRTEKPGHKSVGFGRNSKNKVPQTFFLIFFCCFLFLRFPVANVIKIGF